MARGVTGKVKHWQGSGVQRSNCRSKGPGGGSHPASSETGARSPSSSPNFEFAAKLPVSDHPYQPACSARLQHNPAEPGNNTIAGQRRCLVLTSSRRQTGLHLCYAFEADFPPQGRQRQRRACLMETQRSEAPILRLRRKGQAPFKTERSPGSR